MWPAFLILSITTLLWTQERASRKRLEKHLPKIKDWAIEQQIRESLAYHQADQFMAVLGTILTIIMVLLVIGHL